MNTLLLSSNQIEISFLRPKADYEIRLNKII